MKGRRSALIINGGVNGLQLLEYDRRHIAIWRATGVERKGLVAYVGLSCSHRAFTPEM